MRRIGQILSALARHTFGYLTAVVHLERVVPFRRGFLRHPRRAQPYTKPEHVRLALEDLGAAFIKVGQILSTRADLLPPAYQLELARLQDSAPPEPSVSIRAVIESELDRPWQTVFARFDSKPLAAASIGQAHAATLRDGTEVIVKVRRPHVVAQVLEDLELLEHAVNTATRWSATARRYDLVGLSQEFGTTLRAELDYLHETQNAERFAANFAGDDRIRIPRVFHDATTSRVLTLERLYGLKIDDIAGLDAAGIDRPALAQRATNISLKMIFEDGFFHADPHPGNFFIEPNGRIGLIDFGMAGTVDAATVSGLAAVLMAVATSDMAALTDAFISLGFPTTEIDRAGLQRDLDALIADHFSRPLGQISLGALLSDLMTVVRRHRMRLPPSLALLLKTLAMCEGLAAQLDPSFEMISALGPYASRLVLEHPAVTDKPPEEL